MDRQRAMQGFPYRPRDIALPGTLPWRRQHDFQRKTSLIYVLQSEPCQPSLREHDRIVLAVHYFFQAVSTLPRNGKMVKSGRRANSCAVRRRLDVPTRAPFRQAG